MFWRTLRKHAREESVGNMLSYQEDLEDEDEGKHASPLHLRLHIHHCRLPSSLSVSAGSSHTARSSMDRLCMSSLKAGLMLLAPCLSRWVKRMARRFREGAGVGTSADLAAPNGRHAVKLLVSPGKNHPGVFFKTLAKAPRPALDGVPALDSEGAALLLMT